jgi:hypothetical protein
MVHKLDNLELTSDEMSLIEIALEKYKQYCWGLSTNDGNHSMGERGDLVSALLGKIYKEIDN